MTVVSIVTVFVVAGLVLYLINTFIPMAARVKSALNIVVVILLCVWLLNGFGLVNIPIRLK